MKRFIEQNNPDEVIHNTLNALRREFDAGATAMKKRCIEHIEMGISYALKHPNIPAIEVLKGAIKRVMIAGIGADLEGRP